MPDAGVEWTPERRTPPNRLAPQSPSNTRRKSPTTESQRADSARAGVVRYRDSLVLLHHDPRFIVLNKPSGLLSVPGIGPEKADCLVARAAREHPGARIVHRLDRDTSGVIVLALDAEAHRNLSIQFQDRHVRKLYEALVVGAPAAHGGVIDLPMRKDMINPPLQVIDHEQGRKAVTHWRVTAREHDHTRILLKPITGRSHQLRLHLKTLGHPILGDDLYAPPEVVAMAPRLCLHARRLVFTHPATGERLRFDAPIPF